MTSNNEFQSNEPQTYLFNKETLAASVYSKFPPRKRKIINLADIETVIEKLDLSDYLSVSKAPQLQIKKLRFTGIKSMHNHKELIPINYEQTFTLGVNIVLIEANEVGKSSIWKTIKFALTGDNSDYDADVRSWITNIWLVFALNGQSYTVIMSQENEILRTILVPNEENRSLEDTVSNTSVVFDAIGIENVKQELQHFFFNRLGLTQLSWTQKLPTDAGNVAERHASWLTYFQALLIPDGGDRYLLCDPQHAYGNQAGLILSAFLGLSFAEPLNKLGIESSRIKKDLKYQEKLSEEERHQAESKIAVLEEQQKSIRNRLVAIEEIQNARRKSFENSDQNRQILKLQSIFQEKRLVLEALDHEVQKLGIQIQHDRGNERRLRESIALQLHFTGIAVTLCPNCDTEIDQDAVINENEHHICRLCGKPALTASEEELALMKSKADEYENRCKMLIHDREAIWRRITQVRQELETLTDDIENTKKAAATGISFTFPTSEEEKEREQLLITMGKVQSELTVLRERIARERPEIKNLNFHQQIVDKTREVLRIEADHRNKVKLDRLGELTQAIAKHIGVESITNLSCSTYGVVKLKKHNQPVYFNAIKNEGERLRIKLAFFLAMMRLSREEQGGRHPGFLIIDQPGSNEMVTTDFNALAQVFKQIHQDFGSEIQILCFTARPEFRDATDTTHIYGPQAGSYAF